MSNFVENENIKLKGKKISAVKEASERIKQFKKADVEESREILDKFKAGMTAGEDISVGYNPQTYIETDEKFIEPTSKIEYNVWYNKADDKKYITVNNTKVDIRLYDVKAGVTPWFCPICKKALKDIDVRMWRIHGRCLNCVVAEETEARANGTYAEYEQRKVLLNKKSYLEDMMIQIKEFAEGLSEKIVYYNETGKNDTWSNPNYKVTKESLYKEISDIEILLVEINNVLDGTKTYDELVDLYEQMISKQKEEYITEDGKSI